GSTVQDSFTVSNLGGEPLLNCVASVAAPFNIVSGSAFSLPGFGSTNIVVRFSPLGVGTFNNALIVTSGNAGSTTNHVAGTAALVPVAGFSATPASGLWPLTVTFTDTSTGTITGRFWDFGDGSTTNTGASVFTHTYSSASTNTVSLTVSGPVGFNTLTRPAYIAATNRPPQLAITPPQLLFGTVALGQTNTQTFRLSNSGDLAMTGTIAVNGPFQVQGPLSFNVAPGQTNSIAVNFTPTAEGAANGLVIFNSNGGSSTNSVSGSGAILPVAAFNAPTTSGIKPLLVNFVDNSTGTITNRFWDFGDGATTNTTGTTVSHLYSVVGTNTVALRVSGPLGVNTLTRPNYISVNDDLVITAIQFSGANVLISFNSVTGRLYRLQFTDKLGTPGWKTAADFIPGNGNIVQSVHLGGRLSPANFYRVQLLNTNDLVPAAGFNGTPTSGQIPLTVTFTDTSTGMLTNRFWNFGDGTTTNTTSTTVSHVYTAPGTNTVILTVSGPLGVSTRIRPTYIVATDQLRITSLQRSGTNVLVSFTSQAGQYYRVEYTDGLGSSNWLPAVDAVPGTGSIVQVVHLGGATSSMRFYRVKLLTAADLVPVASFTATPTGGQAPLPVTFADHSTGLITNRLWTFGDGTTTNTTATLVGHQYSAPGTNTVTLTVFGPSGTHAFTRTNYIVVRAFIRITSLRFSGTN